jgi:hypothetical protein
MFHAPTWLDNRLVWWSEGQMSEMILKIIS